MQQPHRISLDWLTEQKFTMEHQLIRWASQNSGSYHHHGLKQMAKQLQRDFAVLNGETSAIPLPPIEQVDDAGHATQLETGPLLVFRQRPHAARQVLLSIHYDTVFGEHHPFQHVRTLDDNTLHGPGVADAKGGIAVILYALQALEKSPLAENIGYTVLLNPDEEIGSLASAPHFQAFAEYCQLGLIYEPALEDGTLAGARKGSGNFTFTFQGRTAHAGRDFDRGRNALVAACQVAQQLHQLNGQKPALTVNVARLISGDALNAVPDTAVLRFNIRFTEAEHQTWAETALQKIQQDANQIDGISCVLSGHFTRPPKPMDPRTEALYQWVKETGAALSLPVRWRATGGCCDGNNFAALGLPCIDTLGVRGGKIHTDQEFMKIDSLVERAQLTTLLLLRMAEGDLPAALQPKE